MSIKRFFSVWFCFLRTLCLVAFLATAIYSCEDGNNNNVGTETNDDDDNDPDDDDDDDDDDDEDDPNLEKLTVTISGSISHTDYDITEKGEVSFNRFPASVKEFNEVREIIGYEPHGAVALQIMAYEMYRRNKEIGLECIKLNNTTNNITSATSRLDELFGNDANYARPYQMAAYLKGATWDNGYKPDKPYTVEIEVNQATPYQYTETYQSDMLFLDILTQGKPSGRDVVWVIKTHRPGEPSEGKYFIVNNCPNLYSQVRQISYTTPFEGLD